MQTQTPLSEAEWWECCQVEKKLMKWRKSFPFHNFTRIGVATERKKCSMYGVCIHVDCWLLTLSMNARREELCWFFRLSNAQFSGAQFMVRAKHMSSSSHVCCVCVYDVDSVRLSLSRQSTSAFYLLCATIHLIIMHRWAFVWRGATTIDGHVHMFMYVLRLLRRKFINHQGAMEN